MSASLFISHATGDAKTAQALCQALEAKGFSCWIASRDIAPGENFQVAIVRAIRSARMMLLVFTSAANNSEEVAKELALASQNRLTVVPLRVENVAPSETFAYEFATRQWIDFHTDWGKAVEQLSRFIGGVLSAEPKPESVETPVFAPPLPAPRRAPARRGALLILVVALVVAGVAFAVLKMAPLLGHKAAPAAAVIAPPKPPPANSSEVPF
ncbi:MAG TPA: toll/interleukin-1 receptor domain-containing protein [Caulobacteraceae bacterium]|jgi:hypothetical protein|nr:toll/interleukin-1 receptor domain-containing protein [Caulobacteraceae bacterium]